MKLRVVFCLFTLCMLWGALGVAQMVAPDATPIGPYTTASGEYDLGAMIDDLVLPYNVLPDPRTVLLGELHRRNS